MVRLTLAGLFFGMGAIISSASADIAITQSDGTRLNLDRPANRVITLSPHLAELVHTAGAGDTLIATVEFSNYPAAASKLPRIGDAFRIDVEQILDAKPDLVIAWESGNPAAAIEQLRSLGIPTWSTEIRKPGEIADVLDQIGQATGRQGTASSAAKDYRQRLRQLSDTYTGAPEKTYFYQVDQQPLFTLNGQHLVSQGLELCSGINIFADLNGLAPQVSREAVIAADPQSVFAGYIEGNENPLAHWQRWPAMQAVKNGQLHLLPADEISRATVRWLDSIELACTLMHDQPN